MPRCTARRAGAMALTVVAGACTSGVGGNRGPTGGDGGAGAEDSGPTGLPDGGGGFEGGTDADASSIPAHLVLAHAAPGLPTFRVCFGLAQPQSVIHVLSIPALPDTPSSAPAVPAIGPYPATAQGTPGIAPGTIRALPTVADYGAFAVTPFVVLASSLPDDVQDGGPDGGAEETCDALIGLHGQGPIDVPHPGRLVPGKDFWRLATVPVGGLANGGTFLLGLTGCLAGSMGAADVDAAAADAGVGDGGGGGGDGGGAGESPVCGADYDGGTNVQMGIAALDVTTLPGDGGMGVQFAHRSSALPSNAGVVPSFFRTVTVDGGAEAGALAQTIPVPLALPADGGPVLFSASAVEPLVGATIDLTDPTLRFGVLVSPEDGGAPSLAPFPQGDVIALPLGLIRILSSWNASTSVAPNGFQIGQSYTFVLLGDPAQQPLTAANPDGGAAPVMNALYDGRGMHVVAFPNVFLP